MNRLERAQRLCAVLVDRFGVDGSIDDDHPLIPCCPVNTAGLPSTDDVPLPKPSIEHSIVKCEVCGDDMWIGPMQKRHRMGIRICYRCIAVFYALHQRPDTIEVKSLNPNEGSIPRRRT